MTTGTLIRRCEGLLEGPACSKSLEEAALCYRASGVFNPCLQRFGFTSKGVERRGASITGLFAAGGPFAVARLIVAIIIDAFQRQFFAITVGECPVSKWDIGGPRLTDPDASASITGPTLLMRVSASLMHAGPNVPEPSGCLSVFGAVFYGSSALFTAARGRIARSKIGKECSNRVPTCTGALNHPAISSVLANQVNNAKLPVLISNHRCKRGMSSHGISRFCSKFQILTEGV